MSTELDPNAVADNVRRYRLALNWTQGELARELTTAGCPTSLKQISNTELGLRRCNHTSQGKQHSMKVKR